MTAKISILGLYTFDPTLFDNMVLPSTIDKETLVNNICFELAELEVIYSDPTIMKASIEFWSKKQKPIWDKLAETTNLDYKPLNNLYRDDTTTDTETRDLGGTTKHDINGSGSLTNSGTDTQNHYTSAFNETTAQLATKDENILGSGNTTTSTEHLEQNTTDTGTVTHENKVHSEGSIGVITPQDMIQKERKVSEFNIMEYILQEFKNRFCILVY